MANWSDSSIQCHGLEPLSHGVASFSVSKSNSICEPRAVQAMDMLPAAREALSTEEGLQFTAEPVIVQYLKLTGLDLTDLGLDDYRVIVE